MKISKLPERDDRWGKLQCSGWKDGKRCKQPVEYIASYEWRGTTGERLYCAEHEERSRKRRKESK